MVVNITMIIVSTVSHLLHGMRFEYRYRFVNISHNNITPQHLDKYPFDKLRKTMLDSVDIIAISKC